MPDYLNGIATMAIGLGFVIVSFVIFSYLIEYFERRIDNHE